jgi:WD40 repeat protein
MMMTCSLDKTIKLWKNFNCIDTFTDHNDWVRCLSISKDNQRFLSGCVSSVIKLWDLPKKKVLHSFNNSNDNPDLLNTVNSLHFMGDDPNVFMTGLRSGAVKIFDVRKSNKLVREFKAHKFKLNSVKFNKDNKYLLSSGRDSLARLWDFRNLPVFLNFKFL